MLKIGGVFGLKPGHPKQFTGNCTSLFQSHKSSDFITSTDNSQNKRHPFLESNDSPICLPFRFLFLDCQNMFTFSLKHRYSIVP